jgi:lipoprotein-anchoring transpeptidase ErfK/SrfK
MSSSGSSFVARLAVVAAALMLAACQTTTYETASDTNLKPRDKELLAKARYAKAEIPQPYRRAIVNYHRKETPGTIVIDSDNHYLYLVQENGKALRYGVTVGEEALAFSGIAKVGNMQEWPRWIPTADIHKRISASKACRSRSKAARIIRLVLARCTCIKAARTRCSASTAPISRNTLANRFPRAVSA